MSKVESRKRREMEGKSENKWRGCVGFLSKSAIILNDMSYFWFLGCEVTWFNVYQDYSGYCVRSVLNGTAVREERPVGDL